MSRLGYGVWCCLSIVLAMASVAQAQAADSAGAETKEDRLYELRIYTTNPGKLPDLHARFRDHTLGLFEKHGMENIIYWNVTEAAKGEEDDKDNLLVYVIAHQDEAAREASWKAFMNDPEWKEVAAKSEANGKILAKAPVAILMRETDFSAADEAPNKDSDQAPRLFELRQYNDGPDGVPGTVDRFASGENVLFTKNGMQTVKFWRATDDSAFIYLLAHKDRETSKKSWEGFMGDFRPFMAEYQAKQKAKQEEAAASDKPAPRPGRGHEVRFLIPTDYSPRK